MPANIVTRFAPSPTGFMHVGGVRTALYAYLFARKHGGTFILRIEDTDKEREVEGSVAHIIESLHWLGIDWDEGPGKEGPHAPYLQSERLGLYRSYAERLIAKGFAYPDPYSEAEVESLRAQAEAEKRAFLYREHRPENPGIWDNKTPLRFKVPETKRYSWTDLVRGELSAGEEALDDFILLKSDGYPTYNFAHIVDDIEMGVTHVMRGEEFISSTPKFLSLYEALGVQPPVFATLPVILAPDGKRKLSKRDGAKDILDYRTEGYLPEALVNFLAFLGWNPGNDREVMTIEELIAAFDLSKVQQGGAQFNETKLDWVNREHLKRVPDGEFERNVIERIPDYAKDAERFRRALSVIRERISKYGDVTAVAEGGELEFLKDAVSPDPAGIPWKEESKEKAAEHLGRVAEILESLPATPALDEIKNSVAPYAEAAGKGAVLWPMRYALTGAKRSPDPFTVASILGKDESLRRIRHAIALLS